MDNGGRIHLKERFEAQKIRTTWICWISFRIELVSGFYFIYERNPKGRAEVFFFGLHKEIFLRSRLSLFFFFLAWRSETALILYVFFFLTQKTCFLWSKPAYNSLPFFRKKKFKNCKKIAAPALVFYTKKNTKFAKLHFFTIFKITKTNLIKKLAKKAENSKIAFDLLMTMSNTWFFMPMNAINSKKTPFLKNKHTPLYEPSLKKKT